MVTVTMAVTRMEHAEGHSGGCSLLLRDVTMYMCCSFVYDEGEREG